VCRVSRASKINQLPRFINAVTHKFVQAEALVMIATACPCTWVRSSATHISSVVILKEYLEVEYWCAKSSAIPAATTLCFLHRPNQLLPEPLLNFNADLHLVIGFFSLLVSRPVASAANTIQDSRPSVTKWRDCFQVNSACSATHGSVWCLSLTGSAQNQLILLLLREDRLVRERSDEV
jgi:hypothetical protein